MKSLFLMLIIALISTPLLGQADAVQQTEEMEKINHYVCKAVEATDNESCWLAASYLIDSIFYGLNPEDNTWEFELLDDTHFIHECCRVHIQIIFACNRIETRLRGNNLESATKIMNEACSLLKENSIKMPDRFRRCKHLIDSLNLEITY